jgi:hypothetical protein
MRSGPVSISSVEHQWLPILDLTWFDRKEGRRFFLTEDELRTPIAVIWILISQSLEQDSIPEGSYLCISYYQLWTAQTRIGPSDAFSFDDGNFNDRDCHSLSKVFLDLLDQVLAQMWSFAWYLLAQASLEEHYNFPKQAQ